MRIIVVDDIKRNQGFGRQFLALIEKWLKMNGYISLHAESSPQALQFYKKHGYSDMAFNDPDINESDPNDVSMGKKL